MDDDEGTIVLARIDASNLSTAIDLLAKGFETRSRAFWDNALQRMQSLGWNDAAGVPLGQLLIDKGRASGVLLTPASLRTGSNGVTRCVINLSSWYVEPQSRWLALRMLRKVMSNPDAIYTDLTPTAEVRRLLPALGFQPINSGMLLQPLPLWSLRLTGGGTMHDLREIPDDVIDPAKRRFLEQHREIGCLPAALHAEGRWLPLLFKPRRMKGVPAAVLVYCDSNDLLDRHLGAVARYLLRHGLAVMVRDMIDGGAGGMRLGSRGLKFARPGRDAATLHADRTDYAGSELCILDL